MFRMFTCLYVSMSSVVQVFSYSCDHVFMSACVHMFTCSSNHRSMCSHVDVSTCSCAYLFTCSSIYVLMCSRVHAFMYSRVHVLTYSYVHVFMRSRVHIFMYSRAHVFTCSHVHVFMRSRVHVFSCSRVHVFTRSRVYLLMRSRGFRDDLSPSYAIFCVREWNADSTTCQQTNTHVSKYSTRYYNFHHEQYSDVRTSRHSSWRIILVRSDKLLRLTFFHNTSQSTNPAMLALIFYWKYGLRLRILSLVVDNLL